MFDRQLVIEAKDTLDMLRDGGLMLATAESCTGGLIAGLLTSIAGSSGMVDRGFITYSNEAKSEMLDVPMALIEQHGAVSEQVAREMAEGALRNSRANVSVSVTGIAGPRGATKGKPVGLVHFGCARPEMSTHHVCMTYGDIGRNEVRHAAIGTALAMVRQSISQGGGMLA
ncbi:nicotinamide-nucleotide amidohydrolase family protein [Anderseniella sp. Alg231-50]|uniref:nicotinamide-nucleotide amidohydrolase family protein n=1 Tax=Anderseniella sp. Alg231-50 TaxID=1922226 RepID=UPI000D551F1B